MPSWRDSLPRQSSSIELSRLDALIHTDMEIGPAKVRRRSTKDRVFVRVTSMYFSGHQLTEFDDFWDNDLGGGVLTFTWEHPLNDATVSYRFVQRPMFSLVSPGPYPDRMWSASLDLEVI